MMLPIPTSGAIRRFNARSVKRTVDEWLAREHMERPVFVSTVPNAGDYDDLFGDAAVVYYCVDDFSLWPGLKVEVVKDMERKLISRADILIAASQELRYHLASTRTDVHVLTHGVDMELFASNPEREHLCLRHISSPRVGYFGLIDERVDQKLVMSLAEKMPDVSFVLTGPVSLRRDEVQSRSNVHLTGPVPYSTLPSLIKGFDMLMMPYIADRLGNSLAPLKLTEYLATGKPIVSSPIEASKRLSEHVVIASGPEQWQDAIRRGLTKDWPLRKISLTKWLNGESWDSKAQIFLEIIHGFLRQKSSHVCQVDASSLS